MNRNEPGRRPALRCGESSLFLLDRFIGHEPALAPERELSRCQAEVRFAALRQATRLGKFSARANLRAAVWDKPRSSSSPYFPDAAAAVAVELVEGSSSNWERVFRISSRL